MNETINDNPTAHDMILLKMSPEPFQQTVRTALESLRDGDLHQLGGSPWAASSLVRDGLLREPPATADRGRALQAVLQWAIDQLQPGGERDWQDRRWLNYNILHGYYTAGERIADVAEWSGFSDIHVLQSLRPQAIAAAARILRDELIKPRDTAGRIRYCATAIYEQMPTATRTVLSVPAALERPIPLPLLHQLLPEYDLAPILQAATRRHHLLYNEEQEQIECPRLLQTIARLHAPPPQVKTWHAQTADYFAAHGDQLAAIHHAHQAGQVEQAAEWALAHWRPVLDRGEADVIDRWRMQLAALSAESRLSAAAQARLSLAEGQMAEFAGELDAAQTAYMHTLTAPLPAVKGLALYRLGELSKRQQNMDMALTYYQRSLDLLTAVETESPLAARIYIDRAMIYIQERPNLPQAHADLQQADQRLDTVTDPALNADRHNAWASYFYQQKEPATELHHRLQAWLTAVEANDRARMLTTAHNLGQAYAWRKQYDDGLTYLQKSLALAEEAGNRQLIGANHKTIGNIHFWREAYERAETHYRAAHDLFAEIGSRNWLGYLCYELAELYAHTVQWASAQYYWRTGRELAASLSNEMLTAGLNSLGQEFPLLHTDLNERQQTAVAYLLEHDEITNKVYCRINDCSSVTAARDLKACVQSGVMQKVGRGRGTRYLLT